jgi:hypothetical protein
VIKELQREKNKSENDETKPLRHAWLSAVSNRSRLPFPRERRPGALILFLNHLNYQLIYAPGFTAPHCPPLVIQLSIFP